MKKISMALPYAASAGLLIAMAGIGATKASAAGPAVAVTSVSMRAGPSTHYPLVSRLPARAELTLYGCTANTAWCDVSWGPDRGWVAASYIQVFYRGSAAMVSPVIAPAIGLTVVAFNQAYWSSYYVGRPWYGQWNSYYRPYAPVAGRGVAGCSAYGCGGAVARPGYAAVGHCSDGTCSGTSLNRGPNGGVYLRHGSISRD